MRSDYAHVQKHGLQVYSHDGDFTLSPAQLNVYDDAQRMPRVDLVIVTLKTTANDSFEPLICPLLHETTAILTLQNGLGSDQQLAELFGAQRVLAGLAFICTNRAEAGVIRHTDHGFIKLGEFAERRLSERATALAAMLQQAKVPATAIADIRVGQWEKLVWNVPFNGLGAALDAETDRLLATEPGRQIVRKLMHEVIATAASVGVALPAATAQLQIERTASMGAYVSSMQVDRRAGRPLEREAIVGRVLATAEKAGIDVPALRWLNDLLAIVDRPAK